MPPKTDKNQLVEPIPPVRTSSDRANEGGEGATGGLDLTTGGQPQPPINPDFQNRERPPENTPPGEEIEFADDVNIYDRVRSNTVSDNSEGSQRGSEFESVFNSVASLNTAEKDKLFKAMKAERIQSLYPTVVLNQEMTNLGDAISDNEENVDLLTHKLQTVQSKRDDLEEATRIMKLKADAADEELKISNLLNEYKLRQTQLERTQKEIIRIQQGRIQDEYEIGERIKTSQKLTARTPNRVLYSSIKKNKNVRIKDDDDEESSEEEYEDAFEEDQAGDSEPVQTSKARKDKTEKKKSRPKKGEADSKKKKSSSSKRPSSIANRPPTPIARGGGDNPGDSSSSSSENGDGDGDDDDDGDTDSTEEEFDIEVPKYAKVLWSIQEVIKNAQSLLDRKEVNKVKFTLTMDELKSSLKMAREARIKWDPPDKETGMSMKRSVKKTVELIGKIADHIEKLNNNESLRKMLPSGSWPKWSGAQEDFLPFIETMKTHLPTLQTDKLQLTTLKDHMTGPQMKIWKVNNFTGVTTLDQAFKILEDKFSDITKHLPTKLEKLDDLKKFRSEPTDPIIEHENVTEMLNYCRVCVEYGVLNRIDSYFLMMYGCLLSDTTRMIKLQPLALKDNWASQKEICGPMISFLEEHQTALEGLDSVRIKLQKDLEKPKNKTNKTEDFYAKFNSGSWQGKNKSIGQNYCLVCSTEGHKPSSCPHLAKFSTNEDKKRFVLSKGSCAACLMKIRKGQEHQCNEKYRKFYCGKHSSNVAICGCPLKKPGNGILEGKLTNNSIKMNNSQKGFTNTSLIFEVVTFLDDNGKVFPVIQLYDNGNTNSCVDSSLPNKIHGFKPFTHNLEIENFSNSTATRKRGNRRTMKLQTIDGVEEMNIFSCEHLKQHYQQTSFDVPLEWRKKYNLVQFPTSPSGWAMSVVGLDHPHLMPQLLETSPDGVMIFKSKVTGNLILAGRIREQNSMIKNNNLNFKAIQDMTPMDVVNFATTDGVETSKLLKCSKCILMHNKCTECKKSHKPIPLEQAQWEEEVKKNLEYRETEGKYYCSYIYNKELENLPSNREAALRMSKKFEEQIQNAGLTLELNKAYSKFRKGVIVLDSEKPLDPNLQVSFITPTWALASSDFKNTKFRMCCNSSFKTHPKNVSLNEAMLPGPQYLNEIHGVLTRWRTYDCVGYADISSAYHQIGSSDKDMALRKIWVKPSLWGKEHGQEWETGYFTCCQFGDCLAGSMCSYAIFDCAERFMSEESARMLRRNIVMDDILVGGKSVEALKKIVSDIDGGLNKGSLCVKDWTLSGEKKEKFKYLSYLTDPYEDTIQLRTNLNWSKIRRGARTGESLTRVEDIDQYMEKYPLTKKAVASVVMGCCHDPLGLGDPFKNNFKQVFRKIAGQELDWKDKVDEDTKADMKKALTTFLKMGDLKFPRQAVFQDADEIHFQFFFDGSLSGCGVSTVIKNVYKDKEPVIRLLKNKSKVTGADCQTAPRAELMSCLLASRVFHILEVELKEFLEEYKGNLKFQFIGDSTIVLNQIRQESYKFKLWTQSKIQEIQELTKKTEGIKPEWYHCSSENNVADILTRTYHAHGKLPWVHDLPDTELKPVSVTENVADLPEVNKKNLKMNVMKMTPEEDITLQDIVFYHVHMNTAKTKDDTEEEDDSVVHRVLTKKSNYMRAKNIIARILNWKRRVTDKVDDMSQAQTDAENLIFKHYQEKKKKYTKSFQGHIYLKSEKDGVVVLKGRKTPRGDTVMKLVPKDCLLYQRLTQTYHAKHKYDSAVAISTQMIRDGYYAPGLVRRLQTLQKKCPACRRRQLRIDPPEMGRLGDKRLIPSKPFHSCQMDLAGPILVKGFTKQRVTRKAWLLIGICDYTRLISLSMVQSLSMDHLLMAVLAHFHRYGKSARIESDLGTNFASMSKQFKKESIPNGDEVMQELTQELKGHGVKFVQRCPKAPYLQGSAEHAVKMTKKALRYYYKSALTTFSWTNLLEGTMTIINRRPIGAKTTGEVLCPGDINSVFTGVHEMLEVGKEGDLPRYSRQIAELQAEFQAQWLNLYYRSLLRQKKWEKRNQILELEDLVLIVDLPNDFKYPSLAKIVHVQKDTGEDIERYFTVRHRTKNGTFKTVKRTPNSLVLVLKPSEEQSADMFEVADPDPENVDMDDPDSDTAEIVTPQEPRKSERLRVKVANGGEMIENLVKK